MKKFERRGDWIRTVLPENLSYMDYWVNIKNIELAVAVFVTDKFPIDNPAFDKRFRYTVALIDSNDPDGELVVGAADTDDEVNEILAEVMR